ncbi:PAS domain S-box protein [Tardiphaga sp. vice304]|uniref:PAS domain S-box protein n=1 Tax=Tardiphaga sp. vice304 TaxID=2592817 RepID=UPI0011629B79|nr:PAS domain S-box protein [Tardiphaga sp. vice304]QDM25262.1 PAS domain S-box protein [Tardiphaga sp. vice304]
MIERCNRRVYLSTLPSSPADRTAVLYAVIGSLLLVVAALPFVRVTFPSVPAFIASYQSSLAVVYIITAVLLFSQFAVLRSIGILYLACGYLFTALAVAGYALTYDDLFANDGLFFPGPETTAWLYMVWHAGLPLFTLLYAISDPGRRPFRTRRACNRAIALSISGVFLAAVILLCVLTVGHPILPVLIVNSKFTLATMSAVGLVFLACFLSIGLLLKRKQPSVLDVWMGAILCAWVFEISLSAVFNAARFDFGYYVGRLYGLIAAGAILAILLAETARIQLRLALLMRQQARDADSELNAYADRERLYSAAVRSSNDAIITESLTGTITGWNEAAERLFGFTASEAVGQSIDMIVPEDRRNDALSILNRVKSGIAVENHETVRKSKAGRLLDVSVSVSPILSGTGKTVGAAKVVRDITDRKLSEEMFRLAIDSSPNGLVLIDVNGVIMLVNAETERLFGHPRAELIGRSVETLVPVDLRTAHAHSRTAYTANPSAKRMGARIDLYGQSSRGDRFPVEISLNPIPTRKGTLILAAIVDISERKRAEKAQRESEKMAQGILNTALDGFLQFNSSLVVTDLNRQTEEIFGWTRQDAVGASILEIFANVETDSVSWVAFMAYLDCHEHETTGTRFEFPARSRAGHDITVELSLTKFLRDSGVLFNAFIRDVTEQRAAEAQFRQVQKMEAIGQLTGGVAHDFNNILTVITGTIQILADGVADRPQLHSITQMIDSAASRGAELTKHLLAFSRKQPLRPRDVDINDLALETAKLLRAALGEQLRVNLEMFADTWSAIVDPSQLTTAILNLALNARDASPHGGTLTISTGNLHLDASDVPADSDIAPGDYVTIEVSDTGEGMDRATLGRAFEPFFTTKEVGKGTGLGLSMVYGFARQSKGHVSISSTPAGTLVTLYLPRSLSAEPVADEVAGVTPVQRGDETILIVEDDSLVRDYVVAQIEGLGYQTISATDAKEAQAVLDSSETIDLLFTDIVLPGPRNGRQIAETAVQQRPGLKVLFTSGYTDDAFNSDALQDSGVLLLIKPYRVGELAKMIRHALLA